VTRLRAMAPAALSCRSSAPAVRAASMRAPRSAPRAAPAPCRRGPCAPRAVELDSDNITLILAAVAGVGVGIGVPVLFTVAEKRDKERIEEIRELNRATLKATGETMKEVRAAPRRAARGRAWQRAARVHAADSAARAAHACGAPHRARAHACACCLRRRHSLRLGLLRCCAPQDEIVQLRPNRYLDRRCACAPQLGVRAGPRPAARCRSWRAHAHESGASAPCPASRARQPADAPPLCARSEFVDDDVRSRAAA
jgi:hypothetical protein